MTEPEQALIQAAWQKAMERLTHAENLFALVYGSLVAALATVFAKLLEKDISLSLAQAWGIASLLMLVGLVTLHLANLVIAASHTVVELEQRTPQLAVLSKTIQYYPPSQTATLLLVFFTPSIAVAATDYYLLRDIFPCGTWIILVLYFFLTVWLSREPFRSVARQIASHRRPA